LRQIISGTTGPIFTKFFTLW